MRLRLQLIAVLILAFGFVACGLTEPKEFPVAEGFVLETKTNRPIEGAYVTFVWYGKKKNAGWAEAEVVVKTDANGRFFHQAPIRNAEDWELFLRAYLPGYQMYPFLKYKQLTLMRVVDKFDSQGVERTREQLIALGYEPEPENKLTMTGWVERIAVPDWYQKSKDGKEIIYMEKDDKLMNERIQEIAWTSQALASVNQRIGPFLEYDRLRFEEATELTCKGSEEAISLNNYIAFTRLYMDWQRRVQGKWISGMSIPSEFGAEQARLQQLYNENYGKGLGARSVVVRRSDYKVLCTVGKLYLEQSKP